MHAQKSARMPREISLDRKGRKECGSPCREVTRRDQKVKKSKTRKTKDQRLGPELSARFDSTNWDESASPTWKYLSAVRLPSAPAQLVPAAFLPSSLTVFGTWYSLSSCLASDQTAGCQLLPGISVVPLEIAA